MIEIRVLVKKLLCLDCEARHGTLDATFERGPAASIHDPKSLVCPRCGSDDVMLELDAQVTDMMKKPPKAGEDGKPRT